MGNIRFTKMHSLCNDFVIIDTNINDIEHVLDADFIRNICDRKVGVGCDQLLIISPALDVSYIIYNHDGTSAHNCINGARCVAWYLYAVYGRVESVLIIDNNYRIHCKFDRLIQVSIDIPSLNPQCLPCNLIYEASNKYCLEYAGWQISFGVVSVGNPHVIINVDDICHLLDVEFSVEFLNKIAIHIINYTVHQNLLFPDGVNVNLFKIVDGRNISLLTYERGCGFTVACGSGACATAYYTITQHLTSDRVTVHMQKGVLELELTDKLISYGQAHKVFDGEYYHE